MQHAKGSRPVSLQENLNRADDPSYSRKVTQMRSDLQAHKKSRGSPRTLPRRAASIVLSLTAASSVILVLKETEAAKADGR